MSESLIECYDLGWLQPYHLKYIYFHLFRSIYVEVCGEDCRNGHRYRSPFTKHHRFLFFFVGRNGIDELNGRNITVYIEISNVFGLIQKSFLIQASRFALCVCEFCFVSSLSLRTLLHYRSPKEF